MSAVTNCGSASDLGLLRTSPTCTVSASVLLQRQAVEAVAQTARATTHLGMMEFWVLVDSVEMPEVVTGAPFPFLPRHSL